MTLEKKRQALQQGQTAEAVAAEYLQQQGVSIIERNMSCRHGEIDIIAKHGKALLFVEVRYRKQQRFGSGAETVTRAKQQKLIKSAEYYLQTKKLSNLSVCRFDVISISSASTSNNTNNSGNSSNYSVQWITNAFDTNT